MDKKILLRRSGIDWRVELREVEGDKFTELIKTCKRLPEAIDFATQYIKANGINGGFQILHSGPEVGFDEPTDTDTVVQ